ncbi:asparagine synthetase B, partial [Vibrio parahaemolyticus]|nr:asparagine synthetase B [Vibrio parahaemolyticus]
PHLYEEYADDFLQYINGMFAFSLWDVRKRRLVIARDRFGEKPLYYGTFGRRLIWGSEPKAILAHPDVQREINPEAL